MSTCDWVSALTHFAVGDCGSINTEHVELYKIVDLLEKKFHSVQKFLSQVGLYGSKITLFLC